jgi:uncharacterized protein (DUF2225 family)
MSVSSIKIILLDLTYEITDKNIFQGHYDVNPICLLIYKMMEAFSKNFCPTVRKTKANHCRLLNRGIISLMAMVCFTGLHHRTCS